jgi:MFS transporter, DHA2 family, multidrug resistance protein
MFNNKERFKWLGFIALALPTLLLSVDTSVLYLALPKIATDLKADSAQQLWIMDIYGLTDSYGWKRVS